jgi:GT2 family glycosyltransferase
VYHLRSDLSTAFPDIEGKDRHAFLEWAHTHGAREMGFHPALAQPGAVGLSEPCSDVTPYEQMLFSAKQISQAASPDTEGGARIVPRYGPLEIAELQPDRPQCSIVIPVYGKASLTRQCLEALLTPPFEKTVYEIIVVDDASPDETAELLRTYDDRIRVVTHTVNQGFARTCNDGAASAAGEYLVFLNNDTIPRTGWLDSLVSYITAHAQVAAVGSKLLYPNDTVQHAGTVILQDRWPRHVYVGFPADHPAVNKSRRFQAVTAASMLIRRQRFEELGGFDATFVNSYEDVDLCLRINALGDEVHYCHESVLYHLESVTRAHRVDEDDRNARTYFRRWGHRVQPDDIQYYLDDGLLRIDRKDGKLRLILSPYLAIDSSGDESRSKRIIVRRSSQLLELLRENVQLHVQVTENEQGVVLKDELQPTRTNTRFDELIVGES